MFIKKIVSWISENPPEENLNETMMGKSEKSFDENAETFEKDDKWSSTSTGGRTSALEGFLVEQNGIVDIHQFNENKEEIISAGGDNRSDSISVSGHYEDDTLINVKSEKRNYLTQEKLSQIRNSVGNINLNDVVMKNEIPDLTAKLSSTSNYETQSSCLNKVSGFEDRTPSGNRCPKSIFTQTEVEDDKQTAKIIKNSSSDILEQEKRSLFSVSESSAEHYTEKHRESKSSKTLYGMLFVVGCSKVVPNHLSNKMNSKYILRRRSEANGLVEASTFVTSDVKESLSSSPAKHVILYPSDKNRSVVVIFKRDTLSDLFQIGRYEKYPIDFTVYDTNSEEKARHGVSRFACRISVDRDDSREARVYAGAFNSSHIINISESGITHSYCGKMDGFTTNGVLILKPDENCPRNWREVSVSGYIYPLRSSKMDVSKRPRILEESNVLKDGTLIDLCGVTLIWRTPDGLNKIPSEYYLNRLQSTLHKYSPECSLLSKDSNMSLSRLQQAVKKAYVYLSCGHVIGLALSKLSDNCGKGWSCPICRGIGPIKEFTIGTEPGFYFDQDVPSYAAFKPCGHVANQKTAEFWSSIDIPNHRSIHYSLCPFCGERLNFITKYVKLTLPII